MTVYIKPPPLERTYTVEEFELLHQFAGHYELLHGKLVEKMSPEYDHGRLAKTIIRKLAFFDPDEVLGEMLPEVSLKLRSDYSPLLDLAFWTTARKPARGTRGAVKVLPDLAVEIWLRSSDLDTKKHRKEAQQKIADYLQAGIPLVWAINADDQTVEVHRLNASPKTLVLGDELDGEEIIPGFKLALRVLFE